MDWFVLLAPLLALAVVALLGFTGCRFEPGAFPPTLVLRLRLPTTIPVTLCRYTHTQPGAMNGTTAEVAQPRVENGNNLYELRFDNPIDGSWTVTLRLDATNPGGSTVVRTDQDRMIVLPLEGTLNVAATWETVGMPGDGQAYQLVYRGLLPE